MLLLVTSGCVGRGLLGDGTSVSIGTHSRGAIRHGAALPVKGRGYVVPDRWRERGRHFGTDELVRLVARAALRVQQEINGSLLGVADLSPPGGGPTPEHGSHQSGRDVDLIYYATDGSGQPAIPSEMVKYDATGVNARATLLASRTTHHGVTTMPSPQQQFDVRRNWTLVRALVTDPEIPVQWLFINRNLIRLMLRHAQQTREDPTVIERAALVMHQPADAGSHADHLHVRVFCDPADRQLGCIDRGPPRWLKKKIKYLHTPYTDPRATDILSRLVLPHHRFPLL